MHLLSPFRATSLQQNHLLGCLVAVGVASGVIDYVLTGGVATPPVTVPIIVAAVAVGYASWVVVEHRLAALVTVNTANVRDHQSSAVNNISISRLLAFLVAVVRR